MYEHVQVFEVYIQVAVRQIDRTYPAVFGADLYKPTSTVAKAV
jgi:hypothetical protein